MSHDSARTQSFAKVTEKLKDLPVADVADGVVESVQKGKVTILTAETGSGKTLLANSVLADASDEPVLVLVPRRFLAINAAESIAELAEVQLGEEVGFAVGGHRAGEQSQFNPNTKLLFATYGYALSSGLINTAKVIVADEVHESGIDTSLARAVLHERLQNDPELRVVEMSATLNAKKQADYWRDIAEVDLHHADGKAFPCDTRYVPSSDRIEEIVVDLIEKEGRKGIAVFRPGVGSVEQTAYEIQAMCAARGLDNVEVEFIYGDMDKEERELALRPPAEGNVKVIVGTNVIESGMNIKWLDTGVSDGDTKVPYYRKSGATALVLEYLPQWRIIQQEGRVKRFTDGVFVLASDKNMESRILQQSPEIERVALHRLIMHAANFGLNPQKLKFDGKVDRDMLIQAKGDLWRLGLLNSDWTLTPKGQFVVNLPVGPEAGCVVHAAAPELQSDAIELAAITEIGSLRADFMLPHGLDSSSDIFDGLKAFRALGWAASKEDCEGLNVSWKRYQEVRELVEDMYTRLHVESAVEQRRATPREMQLMLLEGGVNHLFDACSSTVYYGIVHNDEEYETERGTAVSDDNYDSFAIGSLRELPRGNVIVQNITKIPTNVFAEFAAAHPGMLRDLKLDRSSKHFQVLRGSYFGKGSISFRVPKDPSPAIQALVDQAQGKALPQGVANTNVEEVQPAKRRSVA